MNGSVRTSPLKRVTNWLPALLPRREYAAKARAYADLLPYAVRLGPEVVANVDGSFTASYRYRGPDMESSSGTAMAQLSDRFNEAIRRLGEGWNLQFHADRRIAVGYPVSGAFADPTSWLIDEERRADYERAASNDGLGHYVTEYTADFTWRPPTDATAKADRMLIEGETKSGYLAAASEAWKTFVHTLAGIEGMIAPDLNLERLGESQQIGDEGPITIDEQLTHFLRCATGLDHPLRKLAPREENAYLAPIVACVPIRNGFRLKVGDRLVAVLSIDEMPSTIYAGILDFLNRTHTEYRASWRFLVRERSLALRDIERERSRWFGKRRGLMDALNKRESAQPHQDAIVMAEDAASAAAELRLEKSCFGYYTCCIVLWERIDPTEVPERISTVFEDAAMQREEQAWHRLVKRADALAGEINRRGFNARFEQENALEAFLSTLPGIGDANVRKPQLSSRNLADFLPLTAVWGGEITCPCPFYPPDAPPLAYVSTTGSTPFALNLHHADVGHTLVAGETGAGKSTLLGFLIAQHRRYANARQIVFDIGRSHYALTMGVGGSHYDVGRDPNLLRFAPLAYVDEPHERLWAEGWIMGMLAKRDVPNLPQKRHKVFKALYHLSRKPPPRSLSAFLHMPGIDQEIRDALEYYTEAGPSIGLLDGSDDLHDESDLLCYEMQAIMDGPKELQQPVLEYLIHRVERMSTGRPTLLVMDEVWRFLDDKIASEALKNWLRTARKRNIAVVFATQALADLTNATISNTLIGACPTKILLANPDANSNFAQEAYEKVGLAPWQIRQLALATPKRDYYVMKPRGRRMIQLGLEEVSLAWIGVSDLPSINKLRRLIEDERAYFDEHPDRDPIPWQARWLAERISDKRLAREWVDHWLNRWRSLGGFSRFPSAQHSAANALPDYEREAVS